MSTRRTGDPTLGHDGRVDVVPLDVEAQRHVAVPGDGGRGLGQRARRGRWSAAAGAVVAVTGIALLVGPSTPDYAPPISKQIEACRSQAARQAAALPADPGILDVVAAQQRGETALTLLGTGTAADYVVFCQAPVGDAYRGGLTSWRGVDTPRPADDALSLHGFGGGSDGDWSGAWGYAGRHVERVTVRTTRDDAVPASVGDGYWVAWWLRDEPAEEIASITWRLDDGTLGGPVTFHEARYEADVRYRAAIQARRDACLPGRTDENRPLMEDLRGDLALTVLVVGEAPNRRFIACVQRAGAPYEVRSTVSGALDVGEALEPHELRRISASLSNSEVVFLGAAGADVVRIDVESGSGAQARAMLADELWAAWFTGELTPSDRYTATWYLTDGSVGGTEDWRVETP